MCKIEDYAALKMDPPHSEFVKTELKLWHRGYLSKKVLGGTVLDLGAGCGETAKFYQMHGAGRIISIEPDKECIDLFMQNFPEAVFVPATARLVLIEAHIDLAKSDIEGGEEDMIVETHFIKRIRRVNGMIFRIEREKRPVILQVKQLASALAKNWYPIGLRLHMARIAIAHRMRVSYNRAMGRV